LGPLWPLNSSAQVRLRQAEEAGLVQFTASDASGQQPTPSPDHARSRLRDPANYRCSLGTNTVLGLVTNGLLAVSRDGGAEN
jgi:hypothetical protein